MAEPLVSPAWHRVAALRPSLVPGLRIVRHLVRDQVWQVLVAPSTGAQLRLNPVAYDLVGRFDGTRSVDALWQEVLALRRDQAPTQDEVLHLVSQLFRAGMLQFDAAPHLSLLFADRERQSERRRAALLNPLMLRTRLADPGPWLDRLAPLARAVFSRAAFAIWLAALAWAVLAAGSHFDELKVQAAKLVDAPRSFLIAWICYPCIKLLHELGHGLAVRRYGGEVREFGVSLMFLVPAPYVDASAASAFASPRERMVVSAAGILVELAIAYAALAAWLVLTPGTLRDAALVVLLITSISTVALNGNPLIRLDGYHILCDALQLPNLASRSQAWWLRAWTRLVNREAPAADVTLAAGERKWLIAYAPLSWAWRLALLLALVIWVGSHSWLFGCVIAAFALAWLARRAWLWLAAAGPRAQRGGLAAGALLVVALIAVPVPQSVVVRGVVWPSAEALVRPQVAGFVRAVEAEDGRQVQPGDPLVALEDPVLVAQRDRLEAELSGLRTQQFGTMLTDPVAFERLEQDVRRAQAEVDRTRQQLAQLDLRSAAGGTVAWARPEDLEGRYARRGELLGHIVARGAVTVRMALPEYEFAAVRGRVRGVEVVLAETPFLTQAAQLVPGWPGASHELPSAALGDRQGGPIPTDPADKEGTRSRFPVFVLEARLTGVLAADRIGGRAWVKLALPPEPAAFQLAHRARQLLLREFSPSGRL
ncbi:MAG TPA: PqqD family peptide modification chaperone [Ramlibacter sp.]|uniref:PqqD family peptide modification chaperone n=1 Tax=Ramlibacter sp. TaxID=1917967 RepID=UPI002B891EC5|nr:PqqD family peptide modification chaperone [Ramlibacter sp.]HVZ46415.1 PqqD family peptide modification chaperone [Ramlibacter sp.]